ncbi:pentapeptide repeat-containing protein [Nonomuraea sp. NPDC055795]
MSLLRRSPRPPAAPPALRTPRSMWWWVLPGALLIGDAVWGVLGWLLQDLDLATLPVPAQIAARVEALRTALAAAAGVGAGVTLLLAVRRQRHQEVATWHTTHDAAERRVTELYTKAAEQLGSDKAPVRLAGLYALERLAQDTPVLRQTIVDVICAYLRMPYTIPADQEPEREPGVPRAAIGGVAKPAPAPKHDPHEERQVRLTAQRILADHLRYQALPTRRWWQPRNADPNTRHWADIRLDLTGATLIDLALRDCRIREATFSGATFSGPAGFEEATFSGPAGFEDATFNDLARFKRATFSGPAGFEGATFSGPAGFEDATFSGPAGFEGATFSDFAGFEGATFSDFAGFEDATFNGPARFEHATFNGPAGFEHATFNGPARFEHATFNGPAGFEHATFSGPAGFEHATFSGPARFERATFHSHTGFWGVQGLERARLDDARLVPAHTLVEWILPDVWRAEAGAEGWLALRLATPEEVAQAAGAEAGAGAGEGAAPDTG